jgi:hypothetical protein
MSTRTGFHVRADLKVFWYSVCVDVCMIWFAAFAGPSSAHAFTFYTFGIWWCCLFFRHFIVIRLVFWVRCWVETRWNFFYEIAVLLNFYYFVHVRLVRVQNCKTALELSEKYGCWEVAELIEVRFHNTRCFTRPRRWHSLVGRSNHKLSVRACVCVWRLSRMFGAAATKINCQTLMNGLNDTGSFLLTFTVPIANTFYSTSTLTFVARAHWHWTTDRIFRQIYSHSFSSLLKSSDPIKFSSSIIISSLIFIK